MRNVAISSQSVPLLTIKRLLIPLLAHPRVAHTIKYIVYGSLLINTGFYVYDDYLAARAALPPDAPFLDFFTQVATSIDMFGWVGLVFLFELETYAVPDEKWTAWLATIVRTLRIACYFAIGSAAYGYTAEALENYDTTRIAGITDACQLADQGVSMQVDVIKYVEITSDNCDTLSDSDTFYRIANEISVIDQPTLEHVQFQGWIDIDNAYVWLIVVFLIEIEVWMQARDRFSSPALRLVRQVKSFFYLVLIANIFIWYFDDYYLYAWDAFLWIFGFWAIEMNLAEWEMDRRQELEQSVISPA